MAAPVSTVRISRRILRRYLLAGETPVVACRPHWISLAEPFGTALAALILVAAISATLQAETGQSSGLLWVLWLLLLGRALWRLLEWYNEWFVATDRRLLLVYGLLTQKVAMMPLLKVTDMNYRRSVMGRLLGYGKFILESAGQDQALREVPHIPDPDDKYRRIVATIFGAEDGSDLVETAEAAVDEEDEAQWDPAFADGDSTLVETDARTRHARRKRGSRWEPVERYELPPDWEWVEEEARRARAATRRRIAVDPDPTPWQ